MTLTRTSEQHAGQIYAPQINWLLMGGVVILVAAFGSSSALASAYGISVVGAMITSSALAVVAPDPISPIRQILPASGPRPAPISIW